MVMEVKGRWKMTLKNRIEKYIDEHLIRDAEKWSNDIAVIAEKWFTGAVMNIAIKAEEYRQEINELKNEIERLK